MCKTSTFTHLIPNCWGMEIVSPGLPGACRAPHTMDIRLKMRRSGVIHHGRHLRDVDTTGHHIGTSGMDGFLQKFEVQILKKTLLNLKLQDFL